MSMERIGVNLLTRKAFAPFGQVIDTDTELYYPINGGQATRYHDLAKIEVGGDNARPMVSIFRGRHQDLPLTLKMVERHPLGSQAFYPLSGRPFLVVVAPDEAGVPGRPLAFLASPRQGVNIGMNVWHGVLTPLQAESEFLIIDRAGDGRNLEEHYFPDPYLVAADGLPSLP